jgi:hypothetical protein
MIFSKIDFGWIQIVELTVEIGKVSKSDESTKKAFLHLKSIESLTWFHFTRITGKTISLIFKRHEIEV